MSLPAQDYLTPDDDLVISIDAAGQVISRFRDDVWDVRVYCPKNKCVYNFSNWSDTDSPLKKTLFKSLKLHKWRDSIFRGRPERLTQHELYSFAN